MPLEKFVRCCMKWQRTLKSESNRACTARNFETNESVSMQYVSNRSYLPFVKTEKQFSLTNVKLLLSPSEKRTVLYLKLYLKMSSRPTSTDTNVRPWECQTTFRFLKLDFLISKRRARCRRKKRICQLNRVEWENVIVSASIQIPLPRPNYRIHTRYWTVSSTTIR